jgi:SAM-dependent methyltransferase
MRIINNNKIDFQSLKNAISKPKIFEKSTDKFWEDDHISEQMLMFHLNPEVEAASKTKETIEAETDFIIKLTGMDSEKTVLDLGCGPGLYVKEFAKTGAKVTGIDFSDRSIDYANKSIKPAYENVIFTKMNYLDINVKDSFDIATLIFYDFCALNTDEQNRLLAKIHAALNDNGIFIFDVVSENWKSSISSNISVCEGGFWSRNPYIEILNTFMYEEPKTEGLQYTIIDENGTVKVIRLYHRLFNLEEITRLLNDNHFRIEKVYKNLKGETLTENSETYGIIARKALI